MIQTTHYCATCGSDHVRRNGSNNGQPKYQCTACRCQGLFVPAAARKAAQYARIDALLVERNAQPSTTRVTGVARMTIARRLKKSGGRPAAPTPAATEKGAALGMGSPRAGRALELRGAQKAQGLAVARR